MRRTAWIVSLVSAMVPAHAAKVTKFGDLSEKINDCTLGDASDHKGICRIQGYVSTGVANWMTGFVEPGRFNAQSDLSNLNYMTAFDKWKAMFKEDWKIVNGEVIDTIDFLVLADAFVDKNEGGLTFLLLPVFDNYKPAPGQPSSVQFLASQIIATAKAFSVGLSHEVVIPGIEDDPSGSWPDSSFRAITLLSTLTVNTDDAGRVTEKILTVYGGVSWGFDLSVTPVPEPTTIYLVSVALVGLIGRRITTGSRTRAALRPMKSK